jgi:hypothetical protein
MIEDNLGSFKNLNQIEEILEGTNTNPPTIKKIKLSVNNLLYLDKIVDLCEKNKINLVFVRCPLHPNYEGYYNETVFKRILKTRYSTVRFLDFAKFELHPSDYFDKEHLNQQGARKFSIWFENYKSKEF